MGSDESNGNKNAKIPLEMRWRRKKGEPSGILTLPNLMPNQDYGASRGTKKMLEKLRWRCERKDLKVESFSSSNLDPRASS